MNYRFTRYGLQFLASLLILSAISNNGLKILAFGFVWLVTFRRLSRKEGIAYLGVCALFIPMDIGSTRHGVFTFLHPDAAGLPAYEFFMWGFLVLHTMRALDGSFPSRSSRWLLYTLLVVFAIPFLVVTRQDVLLWTTLGALLITLFFFHEKMDLIYMGYMIGIGALWEYVGVWSGEWVYPGAPPGGVPIWFVTMWGGIGLFVRRLIYPLVYAAETESRVR